MLGKLPDSKIIKKLESNDNQANNAILKHLYKRFYPMAVSVVMQYNGNENEAEDVFQEALIALYENVKAKKFRGDSSINTYLYATIRNIWFSKLKKSKRIIDQELNEGISEGSPINFDDNDDTVCVINKLLDEVGESCREILKAYYYENCSMRAIKERMGFMNEQSAKTQKYKCLQKLIKLVENNKGLKDYLCDLV